MEHPGTQTRIVLPGFLERMRQRLKQSCDDSHQPWPARGRYARYDAEPATAVRLAAFQSDVDTVAHADHDVATDARQAPEVQEPT